MVSFSRFMVGSCAVEDFAAVRSMGWLSSGCYAVIPSLLPCSQHCVLLSCDRPVTGHRQLRWISPACFGRGYQMTDILGVGSATGPEPHSVSSWKSVSKGSGQLPLPCSDRADSTRTSVPAICDCQSLTLKIHINIWIRLCWVTGTPWRKCAAMPWEFNCLSQAPMTLWRASHWRIVGIVGSGSK